MPIINANQEPMPNNQSPELQKWIAKKEAESLTGKNWIRPNIPAGGDPGGPGPGPHPGTGTGTVPPPPFAPATYTFTIDNIEIMNTRSRHEDTNHVSISAATGSNPPTTVLRDLGNQNNGLHPVGLTVGPISVNDANIGVVFNYQVLNSGHQNQQTINSTLTQVGDTLASKGAAAATAAIGTAIGLSTGSVVLPVIGSVIGALAGWLVGSFAGLIVANCDGPVASELVQFKGGDLWARTAIMTTLSHVTFHPGIDSSGGCGSNSKYNVHWTIVRT